MREFPLRLGGQRQHPFVVVAAERADGAAVEEHLGAVAHLAEGEQPAVRRCVWSSCEKPRGGAEFSRPPEGWSKSCAVTSGTCHSGTLPGRAARRRRGRRTRSAGTSSGTGAYFAMTSRKRQYFSVGVPSSARGAS